MKGYFLFWNRNFQCPCTNFF